MSRMTDEDRVALAVMVSRYGQNAVRAAIAPEAVEAVKALAPRELETVCLVAKGHTIKTAARAMRISMHTADHNMKQAREKLGINTRAEAAALAVRAGLV